MGNRLFGMMDMAIVGVPVLAFCIWQLVSINREIARDRKDKSPEGALPERALPERALPERSGHPVGEHREDEG